MSCKNVTANVIFFLQIINLSQIYKYKDIKSLKFMGQRVPGAFQEAQPHPP